MTTNTTYEQLAQAPVGDNILAQIAATARDVLAAQQAVADAEQALKDRQRELRALEDVTLPELLSAAAQTELTTVDGLRVTVKEFIRGGPAKDRAKAAYQWLKDNGQGGIVKVAIAAELGKDASTKAQEAVEKLKAQGVEAEVLETVHPQSLLAVVREMLEEGKDVPLDLLGIVQQKKAEVKPVKRSKKAA